MSGTPVSACVMVRDMAGTAGRAIKSVRPFVDEVCVLDTGSTDGTLELLDELAAAPGAPIRIEQAEWPNHYGQARTLNTAMATHDWVLTLDADEALIGGRNLRGVIARAVERGASVCFLGWNAGDASPARLTGRSPRSPGRPISIILPTQNKLFDRREGRWRGLAYECWVADDPRAYLWVTLSPRSIGSPWIYHLRRSVTRAHYDSYEPLLEQCAADPGGTDSPHALALLGYRRLEQRRWNDAIELIERYVEEGWADQAQRFNCGRLDALLWLVIAYRKVGRAADAAAAAEGVHGYLRDYRANGAGELPPPGWLQPKLESVLGRSNDGMVARAVPAGA